MTERSDFERDADLSLGGITFANDANTGALLVNEVKADEFDPRIANDIEGLLFLGYLTQDVHLFNHHFVLKTLTRGERLATALVAKEYEETMAYGDALQTAHVAACTMSVDGRALSVPVSPDDNRPLERIRANFMVVQNWYDPVLEALFAEYGNLMLRQVTAFAELAGKSIASRATP